MKLSEAWLIQVESDYHAAERIYDADDYRTYCQTIAKYQQTIEKLVKAMASLLDEVGISLPQDHGHYPQKLIQALRRIPNDRRTADIYHLLSATFSNERCTDIMHVCILAPKLPDKKGDPLKRNTEYPFHLSDGTWCAPAAMGVFSREEVTNSRKISLQLYTRVNKIVSLLRRRSVQRVS